MAAHVPQCAALGCLIIPARKGAGISTRCIVHWKILLLGKAYDLDQFGIACKFQADVFCKLLWCAA